MVVYPGRLDKTGNLFLDARIYIDGALWVGNITLTSKLSEVTELHDLNMDKVLFYVVWNNDLPTFQSKKYIFSMQFWRQSNAVENFKRVLSIESFPLPGHLLEGKQTIDKTEKTKGLNGGYAKVVKMESKDIEATSYTEDEEKVIHYLHEYLDLCKKKVPVIKGEVRDIKITEWHRQTERFYPEYGGHCKPTPKIVLLGNWLFKAGFDCNNRIRIIPFDRMLIIIPNR
jgi:hypothetical protein